MPDCENCKCKYFCCKMRVKVNFWERLKIRLRGFGRCFEQDPEGKWLLKFPDRRCFFLNENNKCKIYSIRPKICRVFPLKGNCQEIYEKFSGLKRQNL